nr:MAG TPA: hypothetical protein [Bacteriophage sp.]
MTCVILSNKKRFIYFISCRIATLIYFGSTFSIIHINILKPYI